MPLLQEPAGLGQLRCALSALQRCPRGWGPWPLAGHASSCLWAACAPLAGAEQLHALVLASQGCPAYELAAGWAALARQAGYQPALQLPACRGLSWMTSGCCSYAQLAQRVSEQLLGAFLHQDEVGCRLLWWECCLGLAARWLPALMLRALLPLLMLQRQSCWAGQAQMRDRPQRPGMLQHNAMRISISFGSAST